MNTYCGTGLANPRNPRGLTLAWDHNVYITKTAAFGHIFLLDDLAIMELIKEEVK